MENQEYLLHRIAAEQESARTAASDSVAAIHLKLAEAYERRLRAACAVDDAGTARAATRQARLA